MVDKRKTAAHYRALANRAKELKDMGLLNPAGGSGGGRPPRKRSGCLSVLVLLAITDTAMAVMVYAGLRAMEIL